MALLVYVGDIVITSNDHSSVFALKSFLEVARSSTGISLCQRKYALELLSYSGLLATKPVQSPMDQNCKLSKVDTALLAYLNSYRRLIGRLIYLTITRLDISYAVNTISQFQDKPCQSHLDAANHVLRYVKLNPGQGLLFSRFSSLQLKAFCDSDC
ncbi:hypothetical protein F2P56_029923 [Juglans regia]|uniref:Secreted RxLR effector protein 161-like n=1 Tax=Juglans regia TaxID=51240 RepID=A0A833WWZ3_JUGRE|nr:hypothetical protein F2P56_029923 [Juglans regia]